MKNKKTYKKKNFRREEEEEFQMKARRKRPKPAKKINKYGVNALLEEDDLDDYAARRDY